MGDKKTSSSANFLKSSVQGYRNGHKNPKLFKKCSGNEEKRTPKNGKVNLTEVNKLFILEISGTPYKLTLYTKVYYFSPYKINYK